MISLPKSNLDLRTFIPSTRRELLRYLRACRSRVIRKMGRWAEDEIIIPTHPVYGGRRFRMDRLPWQRTWFQQLDSGHWYEHLLTAPSQAGKSLSGYVIPICYNLFEVQRDVIAGVTAIEMAEDKWERDIKPAIEQTRYKELLPSKGMGSRGGFADLITFRNGISLKFMSAHGGDKSRSHYTSPVLIFTEVDGYQASSVSAEAHPIKQIEARARSVSRALRYVIKECTVTDEEGYIWSNIANRSTNSRLHLQCPHCELYGLPERENLKGWQDAASEVEAEKNSRFHCPTCDEPWTEEQRYEANKNAKLVHVVPDEEADEPKWQTISKEGKIEGTPRETKVFGLRIAAANNTFLSAGDIGMDEWEGLHDPDEINAEKNSTQFVFCLPFQPPGQETLVKLDQQKLAQRKLKYPKGQVPKQTKFLTVGIDVGKYRSDWVAMAWLYPERIGLVFDYGRIEHKIDIGGNKLADANALGFTRCFYETMTPFLFGEEGSGLFGTWADPEGEIRTPDQVLIDCRWQGDEPDDTAVYDALRAWKSDKQIASMIGKGWRSKVMGSMGHGKNQYGGKNTYRRPTTGSNLILKPLGHHYHLAYDPKEKLHVLHANVDAWKTIFQNRLVKDAEAAGSVAFYDSVNPNEHKQLVKEFDAERREPTFEAGKGRKEKWVVKRERNHKLDAAVLAIIGAHRVGFRVDPRKDPKQGKPQQQTRRVLMQGNKAFSVLNR